MKNETNVNGVAEELRELIEDGIMTSSVHVEKVFQNKNQLWVLTNDNQVFRVTVERDNIVKPEDFNND